MRMTQTYTNIHITYTMILLSSYFLLSMYTNFENCNRFREYQLSAFQTLLNTLKTRVP